MLSSLKTTGAFLFKKSRTIRGLILIGTVVVFAIWNSPSVVPLEEFRDASIAWLKENPDTTKTFFEPSEMAVVDLGILIEDRIRFLSRDILDGNGARSSAGCDILLRLSAKETVRLTAAANALSRNQSTYLTRDERLRIDAIAGLLTYLTADKRRVDPAIDA